MPGIKRDGREYGHGHRTCESGEKYRPDHYIGLQVARGFCQVALHGSMHSIFGYAMEHPANLLIWRTQIFLVNHVIVASQLLPPSLK